MDIDMQFRLALAHLIHTIANTVKAYWAKSVLSFNHGAIVAPLMPPALLIFHGSLYVGDKYGLSGLQIFATVASWAFLASYYLDACGYTELTKGRPEMMTTRHTLDIPAWVQLRLLATIFVCLSGYVLGFYVSVNMLLDYGFGWIFDGRFTYFDFMFTFAILVQPVIGLIAIKPLIKGFMELPAPIFARTN